MIPIRRTQSAQGLRRAAQPPARQWPTSHREDILYEGVRCASLSMPRKKQSTSHHITSHHCKKQFRVAAYFLFCFPRIDISSRTRYLNCQSVSRPNAGSCRWTDAEVAPGNNFTTRVCPLSCMFVSFCSFYLPVCDVESRGVACVCNCRVLDRISNYKQYN